MHEFTPEQIESILDCLNHSQPHVDLPASVLGCVREVISYALTPNVELIDEAIYFSLPGTNLTLIARPRDGRYAWSGLTKDGTIYNNDLVELAKIFLSEHGLEREFMIDHVSVAGRVIWVNGRFDFVLDGAK